MSSRLVEVGKDLTAGTMAGIAQLLVGHPFDTVKVKLQSQMAEMSSNCTVRQQQGGTARPQYSGAWDAVKKIMASEGLGGLYRGLSAPLAAVALFNAVLFTARGQMEDWLGGHNRKQGLPLSVRQQMVAGVGAGVAVSFVACPTELIKCRLQAQSCSIATTDSAPPPPRTLLELDSPTGIIEEENKAAREHEEDTSTTTIIAEAMLNPNSTTTANIETTTTTTTLSAGAQGECIGLRTLVVHQDETAAVDVEAAPGTVTHSFPPAPKYSGSLDVAVQIFQREGGLLGFFKGLSPTFLREVFGNAAYFGSYQGTKQLLSKGGTGEDLSTGLLLVAGGVAGAMFWVCVYPADVIKSMIQVDDYRNPTYTGVFDAFRKVFKSQGILGFYCGFGPAMARSVLANAVCFSVYELVRKAFK